MTYEKIYSEIWKGDYDDSLSEVIKHTVKQLRKKISDVEGKDSYIINIRGVGYKLNDND